MSVIVFCGPTLRPEDVRAEIEADVRPPAGRGDLARAALERPSAIGLIDGYFARVPAVWHKEILWAMSEGIHVFGAASMGALRAAELAPFGMEGVGAIFEQYRNGDLADDDEVAIAHARDDRGYRPLSDAMVNVRATLAAAVRANIIGDGARRRLAATAKDLNYADRSYPRLLEAAERHEDIPRAELAALRDWLPTGRVDQKREDALAMLRRMREQGRDGWPRKRVEYRFAATDAWEALFAIVTSEAAALDRRSQGAAPSALIDELLASGQADAAGHAALARALCLELARRKGIKIDPRAVDVVVEAFRQERGLLSAESFDRWLQEQQLDDSQLSAYFQREATVRRIRSAFEGEMLLHLTDHLREAGQFGALASRAASKKVDLEARGLDVPDIADLPVDDDELWRWYFTEHLRCARPANLEAFARGQNADLAQLRAAVLREYCYLGKAASR